MAEIKFVKVYFYVFCLLLKYQKTNQRTAQQQAEDIKQPWSQNFVIVFQCFHFIIHCSVQSRLQIVRVTRRSPIPVRDCFLEPLFATWGLIPMSCFFSIRIDPSGHKFRYGDQCNNSPKLRYLLMGLIPFLKNETKRTNPQEHKTDYGDWYPY